jgi:hypothetical protein
MFRGRRDSRVSARAMAMAREPPYVFGADTGHLSRYREMKQSTKPDADDAKTNPAEKKQQSAPRGRLSLDNWGPHTCSAPKAQSNSAKAHLLTTATVQWSQPDSFPRRDTPRLFHSHRYW